MANRTHMGLRIRERRMDLGLRQADLAARVGISAPYLNLIEHDRRRIGGKLLVALARELEIEAGVLSEGAEAGLVSSLAAIGQGTSAEVDRAADLAARFPGWAGVLAAQRRRVQHLEETVEALSDRLSHDPRLAASLHEVLSVVTAIRATAAILTDTDDIDADWLARFHRNLGEDSERLTRSAGALVAYLDGGAGEVAAGMATPQEEFEAWLGSRTGLPQGAEARAMAASWLNEAETDAARMPEAEVVAAMSGGVDPAKLAARFGVPLIAAFRRLAGLPAEVLGEGPFGLIRCDAAGAVTFRQLAGGFQMPRLGAACPLWPLYQSLSRPGVPMQAMVEQATRRPQRFLVWAITEPAVPPVFGLPPVYTAAMLLRAALPDEVERAAPVGTSCRVCPRTDCPARREASVLPE